MTPEALSFTEIPGGREAVDRAYAETAIVSALGQARLSAALDRIGPPGQMRWNPAAGELVMRGKLFAAEQLGSFDGETWLWSWANPYLEIPEAKTTIARSLRDRASTLGVAALAVPMIAAADERIPYLFGAIGLGHSDAEAYYIANQSQVYLFAPGQLGPPPAPLEALRTAIASVEASGMTTDIAAGLPLAAARLGLPLVRSEHEIVVGEGRDAVHVPLGGAAVSLVTLGLCFVSKQLTIDDVLAHLRAVRGVAELKFTKLDEHTLEHTSNGCTIRIARTDELREVMREANRTGTEDAKRFGAVLVVSVGTTSEFEGPAFAIADLGLGFGGKTWMPTDALERPKGGALAGPVVPSAALHVFERLNAIHDALAYDVLTGAVYPRG